MDQPMRKRRQGTCNEKVRESWEPTAALVECGRPVYGNNLCGMHSSRARNGVPMDRPLRDQHIARRTVEEVRFRDVYGRKLCAKCGNFLSESDFGRSKNSPDGFQHNCTMCTNLYKYKLDRNQIEAMLRSQNWQCANPACDTAIEMRTKGDVHGSRRPRRSNGKSIACVDHDHLCCPRDGSCGKCIRGLLCWHCNVSAGMSGDSPEKLIGLAKYIASAPAKGGGY